MLYAFGSNGAGQLGLGHSDDRASPEQVTFVNDRQDRIPIGSIEKIVAGGNHTIVLDEHGVLYAAGNNEDGRCGCKKTTSSKYMQQIDDATAQSLGPIYDLSATWSGSFFVAFDRTSIYACGSGEHGELGLGDGVTLANEPRRLSRLGTAKIRSIVSGLSHTVVILDNGHVWGWGRGRKGQLGSLNSDQWTPQRVRDVGFAAVNAVAGAEFTCLLGRRETGDIMILSSDKRDRFRLRADIPRSVSQWTSVAAAWSTVFVQLLDGRLVCWGRKDRGQIPPESLPAVDEFAAGSEHWLALSKSGNVLAGGWGEHGNCGFSIDQSDVVKGRFNTINLPSPATRVFAGCATSFVVVEKHSIDAIDR